MNKLREVRMRRIFWEHGGPACTEIKCYSIYIYLCNMYMYDAPPPYNKEKNINCKIY